jgi:hypothetical protein
VCARARVSFMVRMCVTALCFQMIRARERYEHVEARTCSLARAPVPARTNALAIASERKPQRFLMVSRRRKPLRGEQPGRFGATALHGNEGGEWNPLVFTKRSNSFLIRRLVYSVYSLHISSCQPTKQGRIKRRALSCPAVPDTPAARRSRGCGCGAPAACPKHNMGDRILSWIHCI